MYCIWLTLPFGVMLEVVIHNRNYYDWRKHIGWNGLTWHLVFMVHVLLKEYNIGTKYDEELLFSNHENNVILSKLRYLVSLKLHLTFTFSSFSNLSIIIGNKRTHNLYDLCWGCPSFWLLIQFHWKCFISTEEVLAEKNIAFLCSACHDHLPALMNLKISELSKLAIPFPRIPGFPLPRVLSST